MINMDVLLVEGVMANTIYVYDPSYLHYVHLNY